MPNKYVTASVTVAVSAAFSVAVAISVAIAVVVAFVDVVVGTDSTPLYLRHANPGHLPRGRNPEFLFLGSRKFHLLHLLAM
jgi:hypothetical protein